MSQFDILDRYPLRKTRGVLYTEKTAAGTINVFKNVKSYDDVADAIITTPTVVLTTTMAGLQNRLTEIQAEKQNINAFITAESIV